MLSLGIVGLPNAGKSSLFKALTRMAVPIANYPFTTIKPNHGIVAIPDSRLQMLSQLATENQKFPATIEFVDIAGLITGAHKGEGLGNQFLSHIREVDAIVEVVRAFEDGTVSHPMETLDPKRDIEIINQELIQADLKTLERASKDCHSAIKANDKEAFVKLAIIEKITELLKSGISARDITLDENEKMCLKEYRLLSAKPIIFVWNISEKGLPNQGPINQDTEAQQPAEDNALALPIKLFADLADMPEDELEIIKKEFGIKQDALEALIRKAYETLGLITFFTIKPPETRAWAIKKGTTLPDAGAVIHTDFKEKFIRAEVINITKLLEFNSWHAAKTAGKIRTEGKDSTVQDGDVVEFKI